MSVGPVPVLSGALGATVCTNACPHVCDPKWLPRCWNDCQQMLCVCCGGIHCPLGDGDGPPGGGDPPPVCTAVPWDAQPPGGDTAAPSHTKPGPERLLGCGTIGPPGLGPLHSPYPT